MRTSTLALLALVACAGEKREVDLESLHGSGVTGHVAFEEKLGKSLAREVFALATVDDPAGRALRVGLREGRCRALGAELQAVDTMYMNPLGASAPESLSELVGKYAVVVVVDDEVATPLACGDL